MAIAIERDTKELIYGRSVSTVPQTGNWLVVTDGKLPFVSDCKALVDAGVQAKFWKLNESDPASPRVTAMVRAEQNAVLTAELSIHRGYALQRVKAVCDTYLASQGFDTGSLIRWAVLLGRFRSSGQVAKATYAGQVETWVSNVSLHLGAVELAVRNAVTNTELDAAIATMNFAQFDVSRPVVELSSIP